MKPRVFYGIASGLAAACLVVAAHAQQAAAPPFATTKVDGTDNAANLPFVLRRYCGLWGRGT
jgi:hypothetical protein